MGQKRKLAAIMFTDIVGYTSLMEEDEKRAFKILDKNRKIHKPIIYKYRGKWLKEMGDGILASFNTVSDAVFCAIEIQTACKNETDLKLRIGIHQGEVTFQGEDVFGSGVNIASRLEEIAPTGGIYVSESVFRNIHNISGIITDFVKAVILKNVKHPLHVYLVDPEKSIISYQRPRRSIDKHWLTVVFISLFLIAFIAIVLIALNNSSKSLPHDKSIAVLPFLDLSPENDQGFLCIGLMEEIMHNLFVVNGLTIPSKSASMTYTGSNKSLEEIGEELNVAYLLQGSVKSDNQKIRIVVSLVESETGNQVWSYDYNESLENIIDIQIKIAKEVVSSLEMYLSPEIRQRIESKSTTNTDALMLYWKGREKHDLFNIHLDKAYLEEAIDFYKTSFDADSTFAQPLVGIAGAIVDLESDQSYFQDTYLDTIKFLCEKAITIKPDLAEAYFIRARYYQERSNFEDQRKDLEKTIQLNPNHSLAYLMLGENLFRIQNQFIDALANFKEALIRSKGKELANICSLYGWLYLDIGMFNKAEQYAKEELNIQNWSIVLFWVYFHQGKYKEALDVAISYQIQYPNTIQGLWHLAVVNLFINNHNDAEKYFSLLIGKFDSEANYHRLNRYRNRYGYLLSITGEEEKAKEQFKLSYEYLKSAENLRKYNGRDNSAYNLAAISCYLGNFKEAYYWLERMNEYGWHWGYPYHIQRDPMFNKMRNEPEFQNMIEDALLNKKEIREKIIKLDLSEAI